MNINKNYLIIGGVTLGLLGGGLFAAESDTIEEAFAADQSKLIEKAEIKEEEAKEIALAEITGEVTETEVEEENGTIVYEFEIKTESGESEVSVDGMTGKVIEVEQDEDDDENEKDKQKDAEKEEPQQN
ncbi:PepSY domain-containing protein [Bacillus salacetis]|uniref:PepSY domain-containing protein n=1 Tax=Bacillus salacetis TaxID=2315464 RepID=UPI003B9F4ACF